MEGLEIDRYSGGPDGSSSKDLDKNVSSSAYTYENAQNSLRPLGILHSDTRMQCMVDVTSIQPSPRFSSLQATCQIGTDRCHSEHTQFTRVTGSDTEQHYSDVS